MGNLAIHNFQELGQFSTQPHPHENGANDRNRLGLLSARRDHKGASGRRN
jgi:hypothetical protein